MPLRIITFTGDESSLLSRFLFLPQNKSMTFNRAVEEPRARSKASECKLNTTERPAELWYLEDVMCTAGYTSCRWRLNVAPSDTLLPSRGWWKPASVMSEHLCRKALRHRCPAVVTILLSAIKVQEGVLGGGGGGVSLYGLNSDAHRRKYSTSPVCSRRRRFKSSSNML